MKYILALVVCLFLLVVPASAYAERDASQTAKPTKIENLQQKRQEQQLLVQQKKDALREKLQEKKATREAKLTAVKQERIKSFWEKLYKRLLAHVSRLEKLIERMEARLAKIKSTNPTTNTTSIENQLGKAKDLLEDTKLKLEEANNQIDEVISSGDPKEAFKKVRAVVEEIREDLKEIHKILVHEIGSLKGLRVGDKSGVTPTLTPTAPLPTAVPTTVPTSVPTAIPTL